MRIVPKRYEIARAVAVGAVRPRRQPNPIAATLFGGPDPYIPCTVPCTFGCRFMIL